MPDRPAPPVTPPDGCSREMTPEKKKAVRGYLNTVGPRLRKRYGERRQYTPRQVYAVTADTGANVDYVCFAYMLYCSPADFAALHAAAGEVCDATGMRLAVADTFFGGNAAFDAVALSEGLWGGVVTVAETGAEVTVSVVQAGAEVVVNLASAGTDLVVGGVGAVAEGAGTVFGWLADVDWGGLLNFD